MPAPGRNPPTRRGRVTGFDPSGIGWFLGRGFPGVSLRSTPGYVAANPLGSGIFGRGVRRGAMKPRPVYNAAAVAAKSANGRAVI